MSVRLLNDALALNVKQSPADTALLFVIAWRSQDGEGCTANVETLARWSKLTVRSVQRCLASLERNRLIRREPMRKAHGIGWRYTVTTPASATGDRMSPVADDGDGRQSVTPTGDNLSADGRQNVTTTGDGMSPNRTTYIVSDRTCANATAPVAGGSESSAIQPSVDIVIDVAARKGIPESFARETATTWKATGWQTTAGIPITRRNVETLIAKWWENCDNRCYYETYGYFHDGGI